MAKISNATDSFMMKLQMLYAVEKQLERALPKMAQFAWSPVLKEGLLSHYEETREHSIRLEKIFEMLNKRPKKIKSFGMSGIIDDAWWLLETKAPGSIHDGLIAGCGRQIEHYEIATYLMAIAEAKHLGLFEIADILRLTLSEEQNADELLAKVMVENLKEIEVETRVFH